MRIGFAKDIHRLAENRKLIISGCEIPSDVGEVAHSDGDVVYHAVAEAILGALSLGDLGKHFPDTDKTTEGMASSTIIEYVYDLMDKHGYIINNIDVSIVLEKPKLANFIDEMRTNLANLLKTHLTNVSIKAGTNEGVSVLGENLAIEATAIVLLKKKGEK